MQLFWHPSVKLPSAALMLFTLVLDQLRQSYLVLPNSSAPVSRSQLGSNYKFCWWFQSIKQWKHGLSELRHMIRSTLVLLLFRVLSVGEKWIPKFKQFLDPTCSAYSSPALSIFFFFSEEFILQSQNIFLQPYLKRLLRSIISLPPPPKPSRILCEEKLLYSHPKLLEYQVCF